MYLAASPLYKFHLPARQNLAAQPKGKRTVAGNTPTGPGEDSMNDNYGIVA